MLDLLRRGATTKFAAVVIFIPLIVAFALWGIEPSVRQTGGNTLARVGATEITPDQFRDAYQIELNRLSQQFGRRLTPEQARMFGIDQGVLGRLVGAAALDAKVKDMGLALSDASVGDAIRADPSFAAADGKFSRAALDNFLRANNLSEGGYLAIRRNEEAREQIADAVVSGAVIPQATIDLLHRHRAETRVFEALTVEADKIVKVPDPDAATLKAYYEANKPAFMTEAVRRIALLTLTRDTVKDRLAISDEDVKAAFEAGKDAYVTPETRKIWQVAFPDTAAAQKAHPDLAKGPFLEAAAKLGFKSDDVDLGILRKSDLIDPAIAEAAFALKSGETSQPVVGKFSTVIVHVAEIRPGATKSFDDVKALVRDRLASERAGRELVTIHDQIESERTAGRTLKEIGEKLKVPFLDIAAIDRNGMGPDGKPIAGVPDVARVMGSIFGATQGVEADAVDLADGGYAWFDILAVTPPTQKPFEAVEADVKARWLAAEKAKALIEAVAALVDKAKAGTTFADIAKDAGGTPVTTAAITRVTSPPGLTADGVRQGFALPKGAVSSVATADGSSRILFRVVEVTPAPDPTPDQAKAIRTELERAAQADALNAYVAGLQQRYGVTINQKVLQQTLGLSQPAR
jgi:peptidyl-prolyl cis-trans isomerase D